MILSWLSIIEYRRKEYAQKACDSPVTPTKQKDLRNNLRPFCLKGSETWPTMTTWYETRWVLSRVDLGQTQILSSRHDKCSDYHFAGLESPPGHTHIIAEAGTGR